MKRYYIALEGIDGSGKSTTINYILQKYGQYIDLYQRTNKPEWIKPFLNTSLFKNNYTVQIPIYLYLAHYNYYNFLKNNSNRKIVIMDRCFLSNICYYFPNALNNNRLLNTLLKLEPKIYPNKIFILDVNPKTAWERDHHRKDLNWLSATRLHYLKAGTMREFNIEIIPEMPNIDDPFIFISKTIEELL